MPDSMPDSRSVGGRRTSNADRRRVRRHAAGRLRILRGGGCLPPTWTVETSVAVMAMSRASNQRLGTNSLPAGPLPAGSVTVTNSGVTTSEQLYSVLERRGSALGFGSPHAGSDRQPGVGPHDQPVPGQGRRSAGPLPRIRLQRSAELHGSWPTRSTDRSSRSTTRRLLSKPFRHAANGPVFPGKPGQPLPYLSADQREPTATDSPVTSRISACFTTQASIGPIRCRRTMSPATTNSN